MFIKTHVHLITKMEQYNCYYSFFFTKEPASTFHIYMGESVPSKEKFGKMDSFRSCMYKHMFYFSKKKNKKQKTTKNKEIKVWAVAN